MTPTEKLERKYPNADWLIRLARCAYSDSEGGDDISKDHELLGLSKKALLERVLQYSNAGRYDTIDLVEMAYGIKFRANDIKIKV